MGEQKEQPKKTSVQKNAAGGATYPNNQVERDQKIKEAHEQQAQTAEKEHRHSASSSVGNISSWLLQFSSLVGSLLCLPCRLTLARGSEELIRSDSWCPYGLKNPWQGQGWSPSRCKWRCIPFRISHEHSDAPALQPQLPRCTMHKNTGVYYAQNDLYLCNKLSSIIVQPTVQQITDHL